MPDLDLDAIEALCAAATPAPWQEDSGRVMAADSPSPWRAIALCSLLNTHMDEGLNNAAFIAAAREAVPQLVTLVRDLAEQRAQSKAALLLAKDRQDRVDAENAKLSERVRELEHSNASLRAAVAVHEAYGKRLGEDMTKLRAVAHAAQAYYHAAQQSTPPANWFECENALDAALAALEGE